MRSDLLTLTAESLAALANVGVVKRAQKELQEGNGPQVHEEPDGTVVGTFTEGVVTRLPPGKALKDAPCGCNAKLVCRHRVALVLAYARVAQEAAAAVTPETRQEVSPGTLEDAALEAVLGARVMSDARSARRRGVLCEVMRAGSASDVPTVRLPSATVRFLAHAELAHARCDCVTGGGCVHVALACWAFREADRRDASRDSLLLELKDGEASTAVDAGWARALEPAVMLLCEGVDQSRASLGQAFAVARAELSGATWLALGLEDIERALGWHRARSARYRAAELRFLLAELFARVRAASPPGGELPARAVVGQGEALETRLDRVRWVSLGARVDSDGRRRTLEVFLADPDMASVFAMEHTWDTPEDEPLPSGPELGRRRVAGATWDVLARGQVVTQAAVRRANREVRLEGSRTVATSVTLQTGDFDSLPSPVRVEDVRALREAWLARPPRMLRPKARAEDVHAVRVGAVHEVAFDSARQELRATLEDVHGQPFTLVRGFRAAAPRALEILAATLEADHGPVRWVAGPMRWGGSGLELEPTLLTADRVVVPDLDAGEAVRPLRGGPSRGDAADPLRARIDALAGLLEEALHRGLRHLEGDYPERACALAVTLEDAGLRDLGLRLRRLGESIVAGREAAWDWAHAAIRLALLED
ncbi:hypothetical protein JGU66_23675 [Myxococcaceae bacterium JPH2]|nr:hypothetical protein [Myxococcaceae bacterium JPH2]